MRVSPLISEETSTLLKQKLFTLMVSYINGWFCFKQMINWWFLKTKHQIGWLNGCHLWQPSAAPLIQRSHHYRGGLLTLPGHTKYMKHRPWKMGGRRSGWWLIGRDNHQQKLGGWVNPSWWIVINIHEIMVQHVWVACIPVPGVTVTIVNHSQACLEIIVSHYYVQPLEASFSTKA